MMVQCLMVVLCATAAGDSSQHLDAFKNALRLWQEGGVEYSAESKKISNATLDAHGKTYPPKTLCQHEVVEIFRQQGPKLYIETKTMPTPDNIEGVNANRIACVGYDGVLKRSYSDAGSEKPVIRGIIQTESSDSRDGLLRSEKTGGFLFGMQMLSVDRQPSLLELVSDASNQLEWSDRPETVDGHACLLLTIKQPGEEQAAHYVWIDPERGYNYLRWESTRRAQGMDKESRMLPILVRTRVHDVVLEQVDGHWFPTKGARDYVSTYLPSNQLMKDLTSTVTLSNVKLGKQYTDADFFVKFPEGTRVWDERNKVYYTAHADNSLVETKH